MSEKSNEQVEQEFAAMMAGVTVTPEVNAEAAWSSAWYALGKKEQESVPRVVVVEVTADGDRAYVTLHNAGGLGVAVAADRAAALMRKHPGREFAVRVPKGAQA